MNVYDIVNNIGTDYVCNSNAVQCIGAVIQVTKRWVFK